MNAREMTRLGQDAMVEKRWEEAESRLAHAVELCPEDVTARRHYAHALWQRGHKSDAIQQLRQAVEESGGDPNWTVELGEMLLAEDQLPLAAAAADKALQIDGQLSAAWVLHGNVQLKQGNQENALNDFHRARSLGPVESSVLSNLATIYEQQKRPHRVLATLRRLEEQVGVSQLGVSSLRQKGSALQQTNRFEEAIEVLATAHHRDPHDQDTILQLAECQTAAGRYESARDSLALAKTLGPVPDGLTARIAGVESNPRSVAAASFR